MDRLSGLCIKHFWKDFKHWSWECHLEGESPIIKASIELPKITIDGKNKYTDPFVATSGGEIKSLCLAAEYAVDWIENEFDI